MSNHRSEPATVLAAARAQRAAEDAAAAAVLRSAAEWADLHPPLADELSAESTWRGRPTGVPLAGPGTPVVDEGCVAELAAALHCSTDAGSALIGQALELRHRLPRLWALVHDGSVAAWQARRVAGSTMSLNPAAAGFVDDQVAAVVGRIGPTQLDRLITIAIARFMPEEAEQRRLAAEDQRHFDIHHDRDGTRHGQAEVAGLLALPDALDLDAAVSEGAQALADAGCERSLDVRRSLAVGELARRQPALELVGVQAVQHPAAGTSAGSPEGTTAAPGVGRDACRVSPAVTLYLHLDAATLTGSDGLPGRTDNTGIPVSAGQIRDWCGRPDARVTVRPVIDLNRCQTVSGYQVPERLREHIALRDHTCVFPWCSRPARRRSRRRRPTRPAGGSADDSTDGSAAWSTDADHILAHSEGGDTSTDNLAPLCRRHHRYKTFTRWRYRSLRPGVYEWISPHGLRFTRGPDGTTEQPQSTEQTQTIRVDPGSSERPPPDLPARRQPAEHVTPIPPDDATEHR